jgi:HEAT repeats
VDPFVLVQGGIMVVAVLGSLALRALGLIKDELRGDVARAFNEGLQAARREHGLHVEPRRPGSPDAECRRGDYVIRAEVRTYKDQEDQPAYANLHVTLVCPRLPAGLRFSRESGRSADMLTGDTLFDDAVEMVGNPVTLAALLDDRLRFSLRRLVAWDGSLRDGRLFWKTTQGFGAAVVPKLLADLVQLADQLIEAKAAEVPERLAANAGKDPIPGVRLWNLSLLQQHFPGLSVAREASRGSLADADPWVRLAAARFLRDEGKEVLRSLLADERAPDYASAEAASLLGARLPSEEAGPLLVAALKGRSGETRRQSVQELGRLKFAPSLGPLCVLLDRADPRTAAAAAEALEAIGDPKAEPRLLDAVRHEAAELRIAAARALGVVGTVNAVEPLLHELDTKRLDGESRRALREAVSAIQSRLAGAEAGQLSLAATTAEAGRLSLATPRAGPGDVSLAAKPDR